MSQLQEIIVKSSVAAFNAGLKAGKEQGIREGRQVERDLFWRAVDLNATSNHIGEFIYLADLKDAIEELDAKRKDKNLP